MSLLPVGRQPLASGGYGDGYGCGNGCGCGYGDGDGDGYGDGCGDDDGYGTGYASLIHPIWLFHAQQNPGHDHRGLRRHRRRQ